jgi:signal transduction histidine kinase
MSVTLNGWRQIAAFLRQSVKTAKSWEREGMPVHRGTGKNALVFAFPAELKHWFRIYSGEGGHKKASPKGGRIDQEVLKRNRELLARVEKQNDLFKRQSTAIYNTIAIRYPALLKGSRAVKQQEDVNAAVADMSRKLVEAQEQERTRIARELHDDVSQRLMVLGIGLDEIEQEALGNPDLLRRISQTKDELAQVQADVQALSHDLHSTQLEVLGIGPAMKGLCLQLAERRKVQIDFESLDVPSSVPWPVTLCLYRVLQECLHNALKHSHTSRIQVQLRGTSGELHLAVTDSGVGFDMKIAGGNGLGLTSIRERVRLEGGTVIITSKPKCGTAIHACVPLPKSSSQST